MQFMNFMYISPAMRGAYLLFSFYVYVMQICSEWYSGS